MNLGDPELELIDPTPNVHSLFIHFDKLFFWTTLTSRAVVRWSKRMYSCAGVCSYEGRAGLCDIALSEPLLKLRPRKDLIETLLHEMIHAYLFVTCRDKDRDGHGPTFKAHMHRINQFAGLNISIYHDFHEEVKLYQTHWWRCNGRCQAIRPHFGIVRRSMNRPPGPSDYWWADHKAKCRGTFVKIKEPEQQGKKSTARTTASKSNPPITKYINNINNNNNSILNRNIQVIPSEKPVLKDSSNFPPKPNVKSKSNGPNTIVVTKRDNIVFNPKSAAISKPFTGIGLIIDGTRNRTNSASAAEAVRNIWANKQLPSIDRKIAPTPIKSATNNNIIVPNTNKHKIDPTHLTSPPSKIKKIDDFFNKKATSILKDVYGQDFKITQSKDSNKLLAVTIKNLVNCPVCNAKVQDDIINRHLDECLNKDVIEKLSKERIQTPNKPNTLQTAQPTDRNNLKQIVGQISSIPKYEEIHNVSRFKIENKDIKLEIPDSIDLSFMDELVTDKGKGKGKATCPEPKIEVRSTVKQIDYNKNIRKSDNFIVPKEEDANETDLANASMIVQRSTVRTKKEILCPCCNKIVHKSIAEHLEECLKFFANDNTIPEEGASTSFANNAIVIDDDEDIFDESMTMNATGTKTPCPCCLNMVEQSNMNEHLDECLQ